MLSILKAYLRKRWVRALVGGAAFVAVIYLQYKLADWPVAVDLADTGKFSPVTLQLGAEELVIEGPVVNSSEGLLLAHNGKVDEIVSVRFDRARLDDETADMLKDEGSKLPTVPAEFSYSPEEPNAPTETVGSEPCGTSMTVAWAKPDRPPVELRFFQLGQPGLDLVRHLEMQATGSEVLVRILAKTGKEEEAAEARCRNLLQLGDAEEILTGELGVGAIAADGATLRWNFMPAARRDYLWSGADGLYQPFDLGQAKVSTANPAGGLQARAVRIRSLEAASGAAQRELLSARSTDGGALLNLSALKIGSEHLQLSVTGNGWVKINGVDRSVNMFERLNNLSPLGALLFGVLNTAFLEGIRRFIFNKPKTADQTAHADA
ncbi:MAG TPA: hypothetical protein VJ842_13870 [Pyrinomonadaceae bacterium]|nr:hypothetical protein [Pyrinomonadaceae bacterium]